MDTRTKYKEAWRYVRMQQRIAAGISWCGYEGECEFPGAAGPCQCEEHQARLDSLAYEFKRMLLPHETLLSVLREAYAWRQKNRDAWGRPAWQRRRFQIKYTGPSERLWATVNTERYFCEKCSAALRRNRIADHGKIMLACARCGHKQSRCFWIKAQDQFKRDYTKVY